MGTDVIATAAVILWTVAYVGVFVVLRSGIRTRWPPRWSSCTA
jgi:hypothetical protein